ncbi:MAG: tetratricopeptide repeat protein [Candidatus Doudnabacteria bacterium]|nr:tetratricopeptide repeat protein [Candidatus Doudnabacteria bacterium]
MTFIIASAILGLGLLIAISLFLFKLGQLNSRPQVRVRMTAAPTHHHELWPYAKQKLRMVANKIWHFILEAKDLKPATTKTFHSQYEKVKSVFRIRIRSSEQDPQWLPEAAELTIKPNPNQNPEDLYLEAIKRNPHDREAYEALGRLYLQNKNYSDAVQTYEYLIKLDPTRDIYYSNLGLSHYSLKEFQKAKESYEKAISINNKIPTRWINLGLCFEAIEDYAKAVKSFSTALQFDKLNVNYMNLLADAYTKMENFVRAEEVLEQILAMEPNNKLAREKLMKLKI